MTRLISKTLRLARVAREVARAKNAAAGAELPVVRSLVGQAVAPQLQLTGSGGRPNVNALWRATKDIDAIRLNLKTLGHELAREEYGRRTIREVVDPVSQGLESKPATQEDIESAWLQHWCGKLKIAPIYHRKVWEQAYVLQALFDHGALRPGARVLGFGCGQEPLPSLAAGLGVRVTATDLPTEEAQALGWANDQNAGGLEQLWRPELCDLADYQQHVELDRVDMNAIPATLNGYDACWSICALEHLGSIQKGSEFVVNSLDTLRPGGIAVHTTEYNFGPGDETIDNWTTVLFRRAHLDALAEALRELGHWVAPLNFDLGTGVLDRFLDLPPYAPGEGLLDERWNGLSPAHLKLMIDGFPCTSFGLIIRKGGTADAARPRPAAPSGGVPEPSPTSPRVQDVHPQGTNLVLRNAGATPAPLGALHPASQAFAEAVLARA